MLPSWTHDDPEMQVLLAKERGKGALISRRETVHKKLYEELVQSVNEMKAIEAGRLTPSRVTRALDLLRGPSSGRGLTPQQVAKGPKSKA